MASQSDSLTKGRKRTSTLQHVKDLIPDPQNRRKHNPRNIGMIADSLQKVGAARSIVIDEHNRILAGNGTVEAAAEVGITKLQIVDADGDTVVAVRRRGLSDEQKRHLAISDNRTAELAEWDEEQLLADVGAGLSLQPWFTEKEAAKMMSHGEMTATIDELQGQFLVIVTCHGEQEQVQLLERFSREGLECKALVS